jgi:DivIVA domain-containing protein
MLAGYGYRDRMALTPEDVRSIAFRKPPIGRRGYDEEEVDAFLDEVERTLAGLYGQISQLSTGTMPLMPPAQPQVPPDTTAAALAEIKAALARIEARLSTSGGTGAGGSFL